MIHRLLSILFTIVFAGFAVVQFNDPDPLIWIGLYSFVALVNAMAIFSFFPKRSIILGLIVFSMGCVYLSPSLVEWIGSEDSLITGMSPDRMYVEESREFFGLLMALGTMVYQYLVSIKS